MQEDKTNTSSVRNIWPGLFLVVAGLFIITDKVIAGIPTWLVTIPVLIISFGVLLGIYQRFKNAFWLIPVFWGSYLLLEVQFPSLKLGNYAGPASIILLGIIFLLIKRSRTKSPKKKLVFGSHESVNITSVFDSSRKNVVAENFTVCDVTCLLGNAEVDLRGADIKDSALVDATVIFGVAKIIIPANWNIKNDLTSVFGSVEDKGILNVTKVDEGKTIILDGTAIFGGVEIIRV